VVVAVLVNVTVAPGVTTPKLAVRIAFDLSVITVFCVAVLANVEDVEVIDHDEKP
jgi:hypothetical protein